MPTNFILHLAHLPTAYDALTQFNFPTKAESKILRTGALESANASRVSNTLSLSKFKTSTQIPFRFDLPRLSLTTPSPRPSFSPLSLNNALPRWSLGLGGQLSAIAPR